MVIFMSAIYLLFLWKKKNLSFTSVFTSDSFFLLFFFLGGGGVTWGYLVKTGPDKVRERAKITIHQSIE